MNDIADKEEAGAYAVLKAAGIGEVPLYLLSFDKNGVCTSPRTRDRVLADAGSGKYSAVHVYSHGWNNVFQEALAHYTEFFTEYFALREQAGIVRGDYRPMLVGIIWPSTAFLASGEVGPALAGVPAGAPDPALAEVAAELAPDKRRRLAELVGTGQPLGPDASAALAGLLQPLLGRDERPGATPADPDGAASADDLLRNWGSKVQAGRPGQARALPDETAAAGAAGAQPAGLLEFLNPREILRKTTVFLMKDRAGVVGRSGVGDLVRDLLRASDTIQVHLTGHSYGARVMLSALASLRDQRKVSSVLLLQPAINAWCFADHIDAPGRPAGAYRAALDNAAMPVYTTFSSRDMALGEFFGLAVRRPGEQGDLLSAAPDPRYAALGAAGPLGMPAGELATLTMLAQPTRYPAPAPGVRVVALDGSVNGISAHGDVRNPYTEWAMVNLVGATP